MSNQILINQIVPLLATCVAGVLTVIIKNIGNAAVKFIEAKRDAEIKRVGIEKYNNEKEVAKDVWNLVDEEFRITPTLTKTIESAQTMFREKMLKKLPGLSDDEIEHLRQTVAGEINKGKEALIAPVNSTPKVINAEVKYFAPDGTELKPIESTDNIQVNETIAQ